MSGTVGGKLCLCSHIFPSARMSKIKAFSGERSILLLRLDWLDNIATLSGSVALSPDLFRLGPLEKAVEDPKFPGAAFKSGLTWFETSNLAALTKDINSSIMGNISRLSKIG